MATGDNTALLVSEMRTLAEAITGSVERARASRSSYTLDQFLSSDALKGSGGLCGMYPVQDYVRCFRALGVRDRAELEELCRRHYGEPEARDAVEAFLQSEELFGDFVSEVDEEVRRDEDGLACKDVAVLGSTLPLSMELVDAESGLSITVKEILQDAPFTLLVFKRHYS